MLTKSIIIKTSITTSATDKKVKIIPVIITHLYDDQIDVNDDISDVNVVPHSNPKKIMYSGKVKIIERLSAPSSSLAPAVKLWQKIISATETVKLIIAVTIEPILIRRYNSSATTFFLNSSSLFLAILFLLRQRILYHAHT